MILSLLLCLHRRTYEHDCDRGSNKLAQKSFLIGILSLHYFVHYWIVIYIYSKLISNICVASARKSIYFWYWNIFNRVSSRQILHQNKACMLPSISCIMNPISSFDNSCIVRCWSWTFNKFKVCLTLFTHRWREMTLIFQYTILAT